LVAIAQEFSPRYERHHGDLVSIDVSGLERLLGTARTIGEELRREASAHGARVHVAVAATQMAALVLAQARPGLTVVDPGGEAAALAPLPIGILDKIHGHQPQSPQNSQNHEHQKVSAISGISTVKRWGVRTLGELAALPPADLSARLGQEGLLWQAIARGEDVRPLVPDVPEERFEASIELEWPIEGLEPLSFVLTRLLEPLSMRLERRDRGAAVLHVVLRLVTCASTLRASEGPEPGRFSTPLGAAVSVSKGRGTETHARRLELPSPVRDVRTLRTLALLDLESHPPPAAIDGVTVVIDPTPGRVLQHRLFARAHPTPEQLSTLLARLGALMGQDRVGAPARVDSDRPGAFEMRPFATDHEHDDRDHDDRRRGCKDRGEPHDTTVERRVLKSQGSTLKSQEFLETSDLRLETSDRKASPVSALNVVSALRRCRQPVPARVAVEAGRPVRVTTDRRSFAGGAVLQSAGPWRTSGHWWSSSSLKSQVSSLKDRSDFRFQTSDFSWDRDEWDVALGDGAVYRIFRDRETDGWFIDAIVD
jgi:protein ImuB